jgi:hypothetical protein
MRMLIFIEIAIGYPHPNGYPDADRPSLIEDEKVSEDPQNSICYGCFGESR